MPPEDENVIDVKKVGFLRHMTSPTREDRLSYIKGLNEGVEGKSRTNELKLYGNDKKVVNTIQNDQDNPIFIKFLADKNVKYLRLVEINGEDCAEKEFFVDASDILYKISLAKRVKKGEPKPTGYAILPGTQVDENPENEKIRKEFLQFETELGRALYSNSKVVKLSEKVKMKCLEIFTSLNTINGELDMSGLLDDLKANFSSEEAKPGIAGATHFEGSTKKSDPNINTYERMFFSEGNIRETMTVFMNLGGNKELFLGNNKDEPRYQNTSLEEEIQANIKASGSDKYLTKGETKSKNVKDQPLTRGPADKNAFLIEKSTEQADDEGLKLTEDEKKLQGFHGVVKWKEGQNVWRLNEEADFIKMARTLKLPVKAGPSGTTDRLFEYNRIFNIGILPSDFIALVIAYILPINAHSLVEVMAAARPYMEIKDDSNIKDFYLELSYRSSIVSGSMFSVLESGNYPNVKKLLDVE